MIRAYTEERDGRYTFCVVGHAGYATPGEDIVCAAASAITYTLAALMDEMTDHELIAMVDQKLEPGNTVLSAEVTEEARKRFEEATRFFEIGFLMLSEAYPSYICYSGQCLDINT